MKNSFDLSGDLQCVESDVQELQRIIFETSDYPNDAEEADICRSIEALRTSIRHFRERINARIPQHNDRPIMIGRRGYGVV
jgi:hypothetical protein